MKKNILLPDIIKKIIEEDVLVIKNLLKDDKEYADITVKILLAYNNGEKNDESIKEHLQQRYPNLQKSLKEEITLKHFII